MQQHKNQFGTKYDVQSDYDEPVNLAMREHIDDMADEAGDAQWEWAPFVQDMQNWFELFNEDLFDNVLPTSVVSVQKKGKNNLGYYLPFRNQVGLNYELGFNSRTVKDRKYWHLLTTLVHEMVHCEQHLNGTGGSGKSKHHNVEFIKRMTEFGIIVSKQGVRQEVRSGKFTDILDLKGIEYDLSEGDLKPQARIVKIVWTCVCKSFSVRVDEDADPPQLHCQACDSPFEAQVSAAKKAAATKRAKKADPKAALKKVKDALKAANPEAKPLIAMSKSELQAIARMRGLTTGGTKKVLVERIEESYNEPVEVEDDTDLDIEIKNPNYPPNRTPVQPLLPDFDSMKKLEVVQWMLEQKIDFPEKPKQPTKAQLVAHIGKRAESDIDLPDLDDDPKQGQAVPDSIRAHFDAQYNEEKEKWGFVHRDTEKWVSTVASAKRFLKKYERQQAEFDQ